MVAVATKPAPVRKVPSKLDAPTYVMASMEPLSFPAAELLQQRLDLALQHLAIERQLDRSGGALQSIEVIRERERSPPIEADHLEGAVAAVEAIVSQRHHCLGDRRDLAVDACQLPGARCDLSHGWRGYPMAKATTWRCMRAARTSEIRVN